MQPIAPDDSGRDTRAWVAFGLAGLLGIVAAAMTFPADFLFPVAGSAWAPIGDAAQHAIAQRYFINEPWGWPLLMAKTLNTPDGVNIAFADGIPLLALLLKVLAPVLPAGFHGIGLWYGIACVAQPIAAVWALRGTGERRLLPALGVALAALAMPAWLARYGHAALTGHFLLLLALGFHLRLVRGQTPALWTGTALSLVATLLVHPYLAAMALAVIGAVPLTLLLRGDRGWLKAAVWTAGSFGAVLLTMAVLGYLGAAGDGGFGQFAMNLLSPVWPYRSFLLPGLATTEIDATGHGGWEGYNYLGLGLLLALLLGLVLRGPAAIALLRRHGGLTLALLALTLLALSHRVGVGNMIVLDLGQAPGVMEQFRASGRFFWPVAYALLLAACVLLARIHPALVLLMGLVQAVDAIPNRLALAAWAATRPPWTLDAPALRAAMAKADRLTLLPSWPCIPRDALPAFRHAHDALALASERGLPVSTMQLARWRVRPVCDDAALAASPLAPGELRLILPFARQAALKLVPDAASLCRPIGEAVACFRPPDLRSVADRSAGAARPGTAAGPLSR
jgi:hypothetical protein